MKISTFGSHPVINQLRVEFYPPPNTSILHHQNTIRTSKTKPSLHLNLMPDHATCQSDSMSHLWPYSDTNTTGTAACTHPLDSLWEPIQEREMWREDACMCMLAFAPVQLWLHLHLPNRCCSLVHVFDVWRADWKVRSMLASPDVDNFTPLNLCTEEMFVVLC